MLFASHISVLNVVADMCMLVLQVRNIYSFCNIIPLWQLYMTITVTNSICSPLENIQNNEPLQHKHCSTFIWCVSASPDTYRAQLCHVFVNMKNGPPESCCTVLCGSWQLLHFSCSSSAVYLYVYTWDLETNWATPPLSGRCPRCSC